MISSVGASFSVSSVSLLKLVIWSKESVTMESWILESSCTSPKMENYLKLLSNISESNKHLATTTKKHQVLFDKQWPHLTKYLFNIDEDPEEKENLAQKMPGVLEKLRLKARKLYSSFVPRDFNGTWPC